MLISRISLRLLPSEELVGDPFLDACVELAFGPARPSDEVGVVVVSEPVRITPTDLVRLHVGSGLALGEIRAEVRRAEIAWRQQLSRWYGDGRLAVEARAPDISLLNGFWRDCGIPVRFRRRPWRPSLPAPLRLPHEQDRIPRCRAGGQVTRRTRTSDRKEDRVQPHGSLSHGQPAAAGASDRSPVGLRRIAPYPPVEGPAYAAVTLDPETQTARYFDASGAPTMSPGHGTSSGTNPATGTTGQGDRNSDSPDSDTGNDTDQ